MTTRRVMKSVLMGFLGTYTSRYSDFGGYWLHGQLPMGLQHYHFDLMALAEANTFTLGLTIKEKVREAARRLAIRRFSEQLEKSGLNVDVVREATLQIRMKPALVNGRQGDEFSQGHMVEFVADALMDNGRRYQKESIVFVAPHDPSKERQRP